MSVYSERVLFFFWIYLCSSTGYQLSVKPALVLENHNKAGKSSKLSEYLKLCITCISLTGMYTQRTTADAFRGLTKKSESKY